MATKKLYYVLYANNVSSEPTVEYGPVFLTEAQKFMKAQAETAIRSMAAACSTSASLNEHNIGYMHAGRTACVFDDFNLDMHYWHIVPAKELPDSAIPHRFAKEER